LIRGYESIITTAIFVPGCDLHVAASQGHRKSFFKYPSLTSLLPQCNTLTKHCTPLASYSKRFY